MTWQADNRAYLQACVDRVAVLLRGGEQASIPDFGEPVPALVALERIFGLTPFERDIVVLCVGAGIDPRIGAHVGDSPTFGHAFASFPDPHMDACSPSGVLRAHGLVRFDLVDHPMRARLVLEERVFHFVVGNPASAPELAALRLRVQARHIDLDETRKGHAHRLANLLRSVGTGTVLQVIGSEHGALDLVVAAAALLGTDPLALSASALPSVLSELERVVRACERELLLSGSIAVVVVDSFDSVDVERVVHAFVRLSRAPLVVVARSPLLRLGDTRRYEVPPVLMTDRARAWRRALAPCADDSVVHRLAHQFHLEHHEIIAIAEQTPTTEHVETEIWMACRRVARPAIDDLARRIEPVATWEDLVLPRSLSDLLRDISTHLRLRHQVHDTWGFGRGEKRGSAITALFHGPSGTGKTLAAEVIAREAGLDLYQIDLSQVVDKYVGETEKRLRRVFDAAERGGAVLLFDEADSLFGKRGNIERGTDRWANLEVSYLLQRMESYRGLAILTTNSKDAIDVAFLRRLRFVAQFPFPDVNLRRDLWRRAFPTDAPTANVDTAKLAELQLTGASIKAIALAGAFHAAADTSSITMHHLLRAARTEFTKLEKPFPEGQVATWSAST